MGLGDEEAGGWLDEPTYERVRGLVPIVCIDALPYKDEDDGLRVGLIRRSVPAPKGWTEGWALVGGRVRRGESLAEALERHLRETLGGGVSFDVASVDLHRPAAVGQYLPEQRTGFSFDPRQHSVALTYVIRVEGSVLPAGEALAFEWFTPPEVPPGEQIGFKQEIALREALRSLAKDRSP